jgi:hypothetical protein
MAATTVPPLLSGLTAAAPAAAAPATLTAAQTAGALPLNPTTSVPPTNVGAVPPMNAGVTAPSGVLPAQYEESITAPIGINSNSEISSSEPEALQRMDAPVQLTAPPSHSVTKDAISAPPAESLTRPAPPTLRNPLMPPGTPPVINDSEVIPATEGTIDLGQQAAARAAAELLTTSLAPNSSGSLSGAKISLSAAISNLDQSQWLAAVSAYWRLSSAIGDYNWALDETQRLEKIVPNRGPVEEPILSSARAAASARTHEAELAVIRSQVTLTSLIGRGRTLSSLTYENGPEAAATKNPALLATDEPLVGPYRTYFDALFGNRPAVGRTREIDAVLPARVKIINDRAAAVQSARSSVHYAEQAYVQKEADLRTVLGCIDDLHNQRREFLNAVLQYNLDIAEYAVSAASGGTPPEKFVAMLIHAKPAERLTAVPQRPAGSTFAPNNSQEPNGMLSVKSRELPPPPAPGNGGWVPSTLRPIESEAQEEFHTSSAASRSVVMPRNSELRSGEPRSIEPRNNQPQRAAAQPAAPNSMLSSGTFSGNITTAPPYEAKPSERPNQQPDPFAAPPADERYGRYGEGR